MRYFRDRILAWLALECLQGTDRVRAKIVSDTADDPPCRYIFIHAATSRSPLSCSRDQLELILTHYQVMPSFLEHVFTFCARVDAHLQAAFRSEHRIIGNFGGRVQHCFNLVGVEFETETQLFQHRQTAAYFSMDIESGKSIWIILKANKVVRESITQSTHQFDDDGQLSTTLRTFSLALRSHLVIFEWAVQNWTPYINKLQRRLSDISIEVGHTPVAGMVPDPSMFKLVTRRTRESLGSSPRANSRWLAPIKQATATIYRDRAQERGQSGETAIVDMDVATIFTSDKLEQLKSLHHQTTDVVRGLTALEQDQAVMLQMIQYFEDWDENTSLGYDGAALRSFLSRSRGYLGQMEAQRSRLTSLRSELNRETALYSNILEYHSMRVGEAYAQLAKSSTDSMENITRQAKRDTVSIHVITVLTLFFLPATFLATFLSTGIIDFEREGLSTNDLGDWTVRWGALKLFVLVGVPLTSLVLSAWALTYFRSSRSSRSS